jgi:hypothetical protein
MLEVAFWMMGLPVTSERKPHLEENSAMATRARADGGLCGCLCLGTTGRRFAGGRGGVFENPVESDQIHDGM